MIDEWLHLDALWLGLLGAYLVVLGLLVLFGLHRYHLVLASRRAVEPPPPPLAERELPIVTVQLPLFNELNVAERLLDAVASFDWPRDRLEIQVLDDSTDETASVARAVIGRLRARGLDAHHLQRSERTGFKAGALAAGLEQARGDLIAIFDADFVPPPHLLRAVVGHFRDPHVGLVQVRWDHLNRHESLLTEIQAVMLDGHFLIEHRARAAAGCFFNFNGTAGIWRRRAIEDAGGWQSDTLTEDLDLSYRAQLRGWRFVFRPDLVAPAELPSDMNAFKGQQHRWAKGSAQSAVKLLRSVVSAPLPLATKVEAVFHLSGNFAYVLLLALALLAYPAIQLRSHLSLARGLWLDVPFLVFATLSVVVFYARPLAGASGSWRRWLIVPPLMALGIGISFNNARAVLAGLLRHRSPFRRTPKRGHRSARHYLGRAEPWVIVEIALAGYLAIVIAKAIEQRLFLALPFLLLFAAGFASTAFLTLRPPSAPGSR